MPDKMSYLKNILMLFSVFIIEILCCRTIFAEEMNIENNYLDNITKEYRACLIKSYGSALTWNRPGMSAYLASLEQPITWESLYHFSVAACTQERLRLEFRLKDNGQPNKIIVSRVNFEHQWFKEVAQKTGSLAPW